MNGNRIALGFSGLLHYPMEKIVDYTQLSERSGYESVWIAETRYVDDGLALLGALSMVTKKIKLSNGILGHTFARTPVVLGLSVATIDIISNGRMVIGLGPGAAYYSAKQGVKIPSPMQALSEYVSVLRKLLSGEEVSYDGKYVHLDSVQLGIVPLQQKIPIFLGVSGPNMLRLAGQIADGIVLNALVTPQYIKNAIKIVQEGAKEKGRSPDDIELSGIVYVSMSEDRQAALDALKPTLADYFVHQSHTARDSGLDDVTLKKIQDAWNRGGKASAAKEVPNSIVQAINAAGTPAECREKLAEYRKAGMKLPIIFPLPPNPEKIIAEMIS